MAEKEERRRFLRNGFIKQVSTLTSSYGSTFTNDVFTKNSESVIITLEKNPEMNREARVSIDRYKDATSPNAIGQFTPFVFAQQKHHLQQHQSFAQPMQSTTANCAKACVFVAKFELTFFFHTKVKHGQ